MVLNCSSLKSDYTFHTIICKSNDLLPRDFEAKSYKKAKTGYYLRHFVSITPLGCLVSLHSPNVKVVFKLTVKILSILHYVNCIVLLCATIHTTIVKYKLTINARIYVSVLLFE
jgi:hypothetical protein